jgi:hypothetical protein
MRSRAAAHLSAPNTVPFVLTYLDIVQCLLISPHADIYKVILPYLGSLSTVSIATLKHGDGEAASTFQPRLVAERPALASHHDLPL